MIGYGNPLRGDDAVGQVIAERVAAWEIPGVDARAVHQLTPELAESLASAAYAIFVDARAECTRGAWPEDAHITMRPLAPRRTDSPLGHTAAPEGLLALAQSVYGRCPPAWCIDVPAAQFDFGSDLSPQAQAGTQTALCMISHIIRRAATLPHREHA